MEMDEKLDNDIDKTISTKCIKGHKFKVPREKISCSASGKSFVTLCPKCNSVARLRKEDVFELYGINPRDHVAVGNLYASLVAGGVPDQGETTSTPPQAEAPAPVPFVGKDDEPDLNEEEEDEEDEEEEDEEEEDEEEEDDDQEYTAVVETVPDVTGKKKTVQRMRLVVEDEDEEDDGEYERSKTPVKRSKKPQERKQERKQVKKARRPAGRYEEDFEEEDMEEEEEQPQRRSRKPQREQQQATVEEEFDPNEVIMELLEESGLDNATIDRIADYVYMQPTGWQPPALAGILELYISPASAKKIALRYSAELSKEEQRRSREQAVMGMMGGLSNNTRLFNPAPMNSPPLNTPLQGGFPQQFPPQSFPGQFPAGQQFPPQQQGFAQDYRAPPAPRGVTAYETEKMIDAKLDVKFKELAEVLVSSKREEAAAAEAREMRNLVFEILKDRTGQAQTPANVQNPQVTEFMKTQGGLVDTLLKVALDKKPSSLMDDPFMKIMLQELISSKKSTAPSLGTTSEELRQRIELQRLANDLEMSQAEFKDKQDGRVFTRDLASQALSKIGEAAASAYIESQRIQAETAKAIAAQERVARIQGTLPQQKTAVINEPEPQKPEESPTETHGAMPGDEHKVKAVPDETGNIHLPCPVCNTTMTAKPGDKEVVCPLCKTRYTARASAPVVEPDPATEPSPVIEPVPVIEPEPVIKPKPVIDLTPEPDPVIEPTEERFVPVSGSGEVDHDISDLVDSDKQFAPKKYGRHAPRRKVIANPQ
jgi:hypothetical protein